MARLLTASAIAKKARRVFDVDWLLESPELGLYLSYADHEPTLVGASGEDVMIPWEDLAALPISEQWMYAFAGATISTLGTNDLVPWEDLAALPISEQWMYAFTGATLTPDTWEHRYAQGESIGEIEQSITPGGGVGSVNSLEVDIVEDGTGMSLRALWDRVERLEGATVQLSLLFTGDPYINKIPQYTGQIDQAKWANGTGHLQAVDTSLPENFLLPKIIVTPELYPNAPDQSLNQPLPLVYGSGERGRLEIAPLLLIDGAQLVHYLFAGHPVAALNTRVGPWPTGARQLRYTEAASALASSAEVTLAKSLTATLFSSGVHPAEISQQFSVTNAANLFDTDPATLAVISTNNGQHVNGDGWGYLGFKLQLPNPEAVNAVRFDIRDYRRSPDSSPTVHATLRLHLVDEVLLPVVDNIWMPPDSPWRHVSAPRSTLYTATGITLDSVHILEALLEVFNEGGLGSPDDTFELGYFTFEAGYQPTSSLEALYIDGTGPTPFAGRLDPDGLLTGTPGARIENRADVVRSIFVQELEQSVDAASFLSARQTAPASVFDGGIGAGWSIDRLQARQLLDDLAVQGQSYLFPGGDGLFKMTPYLATADIQWEFDQSNILVTNPEADASSYQSSFTCDLSSPDLVANTFRVRYGWHAGLKQFTKSVYATPAGSNHRTQALLLQQRCTDSLIRYKNRPPWEYDAYWISHRLMAETFLAHRVSYFWSQHCVVTFETTLAACHLEVGDMVRITHPELPATLQGLPFEVLRMRTQPSRGVIFLVCMRLLVLSFQYFRIRAQDGRLWYWHIGPDNTHWWGLEIPETPTRVALDVPYSPIPYWVVLTSPTGGTWYVYPTHTGGPTAELTPPPIGTGITGSPTLRGQSTGTWQFSVTRRGENDITRIL